MAPASARAEAAQDGVVEVRVDEELLAALRRHAEGPGPRRGAGVQVAEDQRAVRGAGVDLQREVDDAPGRGAAYPPRFPEFDP